jgi:hypothetical protein
MVRKGDIMNAPPQDVQGVTGLRGVTGPQGETGPSGAAGLPTVHQNYGIKNNDPFDVSPVEIAEGTQIYVEKTISTVQIDYVLVLSQADVERRFVSLTLNYQFSVVVDGNTQMCFPFNGGWQCGLKRSGQEAETINGPSGLIRIDHHWQGVVAVPQHGGPQDTTTIRSQIINPYGGDTIWVYHINLILVPVAAAQHEAVRLQTDVP